MFYSYSQISQFTVSQADVKCLCCTWSSCSTPQRHYQCILKLVAFGVAHNDDGINIIGEEVRTVNCQLRIHRLCTSV